MTKSIIIKIAALFIVAVTFTACNKYEEGSNYSLISKKSRVANEWKLNRATAENSGVTADITTTLTLSTTKDGTFTRTATIATIDFAETGNWVFNDDKTSLIMTDSDGDVFTGTIKKLKSDEMTLVNVDGSTTYTYEYVTK